VHGETAKRDYLEAARQVGVDSTRASGCA